MSRIHFVTTFARFGCFFGADKHPSCSIDFIICTRRHCYHHMLLLLDHECSKVSLSRSRKNWRLRKYSGIERTERWINTKKYSSDWRCLRPGKRNYFICNISANTAEGEQKTIITKYMLKSGLLRQQKGSMEIQNNNSFIALNKNLNTYV